MKLIYYVMVCLWIFINPLDSKESTMQYTYPVADFENGNQLVVIQQKSLETIEVWFIDQKYQTMVQGLSSFSIPANVRILPSEKGFSFIDNGFIKIKYFEKRSPKILGMYEPISLISSMNWINEDTFYFSARQGDYYQTFQGNVNSQIKRLTCQPFDYLYPTKIGQNLYCIKRLMDQQFEIVMLPWNPIDFDQYQTLPETVIISATTTTLCFLKMISDQQGFYLQAPYLQDTHENQYTFSCYHLVLLKNRQWESQELFKFTIPIQYLKGPDRLYQSMELFLPNYMVDNYIYYVDFNTYSNRFELLQYNILTKNIKNITDDFMKKNKFFHGKLFAPYISRNKIYCGTIDYTSKNTDDIENNFGIRLPHITTK